MSLGMHFAINKTDVKKLLALEEDEDRIEYVSDVIEERDDDWSVETDKSWFAIDLSFTAADQDSRDIKIDGPLAFVIFGGQWLCTGEEYVMVLKTPEQVQQVAEQLSTITEAAFRARYRVIAPTVYGEELNDEYEDYTWSYYSQVVEFYKKAAAAKRSVLFTVG